MTNPSPDHDQRSSSDLPTTPNPLIPGATSSRRLPPGVRTILIFAGLAAVIVTALIGGFALVGGRTPKPLTAVSPQATATASPTPFPTAPPSPTAVPTPTPLPTATATPDLPPPPTAPPVSSPQFTNWSATSSDPALSFTFTLNAQRTGVSAYTITLSGYTCGGGGGSASGSVNGTSANTWPIVGGSFTIPGSMLYNGTSMHFTISGMFDPSGTSLSGTWAFSPSGTDCSAMWTATGS